MASKEDRRRGFTTRRHKGTFLNNEHLFIDGGGRYVHNIHIYKNSLNSTSQKDEFYSM